MAYDEEEALKVLDKLMDEIVDKIFTLSQENIVKNGSVDTGKLLTTANINREFLSKEIVYPTIYSKWIEFGTMPHAVSLKGIESIQRWCERKLGMSEKEALSTAYAIANKIRREGMKAKPFLRPALDEVLIRGI